MSQSAMTIPPNLIAVVLEPATDHLLVIENEGQDGICPNDEDSQSAEDDRILNHGAISAGSQPGGVGSNALPQRSLRVTFLGVQS
jgi:hypothetical protein